MMKILLPKVLLFSVIEYLQSIIVCGFGTSKSNVYIFGCFEKLLKLINPIDFKCDSMFGANSLFLSVIFYRSEHVFDGKQKEIRGYFALIR